jgi:YD repeat-containing protein
VSSLGDDDGNVTDTTDPDDIDTRDYHDSLGRTVQTMDDFTNGVVTDDSNQTTIYTYNGVGMISLTATLTNGAVKRTTTLRNK